MTSIFKSNKFFRIIKHFVLCIPLIFCLGVSIYTIVNPNAKDSYSGDSNDVVYIEDNFDFVNGDSYYFDLRNYVSTDIADLTFNNNRKLYITDININVNTSAYSFDNVRSIAFYKIANNSTFTLYCYDDDDTQLFSIGSTSAYLQFDFIYISGNLPSTIFTSTKIFYYLIDNNPLDKAFTYSMSEFNQIGFNKFDFVGLFDGIFTDNIHNVYTDFINSYLNYYLMIECVYFVPWVIHMFIHFAYDLGDYFTSSFRRKKEDD